MGTLETSAQIAVDDDAAMTSECEFTHLCSPTKRCVITAKVGLKFVKKLLNLHTQFI